MKSQTSLAARNCRLQEWSKMVLLLEQLDSLELEQLLGSPLHLTVNLNMPFVPESCDNSGCVDSGLIF